eukprot:COSAG02_NODE_1502_length_12258_cov_12.486142_5_plen_141_part_00
MAFTAFGPRANAAFKFDTIVQMVRCLFALCILGSGATSAIPGVPPSCVGRLNEHPIEDGLPRQVSKVKNGERLVAGGAGSEIAVVHVSGTAFEMGEAHGKLMAKELKEFLPLVFAYMEKTLPASEVPPRQRSPRVAFPRA